MAGRRPVDTAAIGKENSGMKTKEESSNSPNALTDLESVLLQVEQGGVKDPELLKRIEERSRAIRERVLKEHGVLEVAVDLIRETRDE
jgi:hypothetical protein